MTPPEATPARFTARSVLPLGFCAVFLLMAAALVECYRMQAQMRAAPAALAAYEQADALLEHVRHGFNQAQTVVRDFLLKPGGSEIYLRRLGGYETEAMDAAEQMQRLSVDGKQAQTLRQQLQAHFRDLRNVAEWSEQKRHEGGDFLADTLPRLRSPLNRTFRELAETNQNGRRRVAQGALAGGESFVHHLFYLLGADLLLALAVAGLNLAYARELGRESTSKVDEVARAKTEMQQLSARLLTIQEEERHRLSRDLHDGIGQLLTALRIEISHVGLQNGAAQEDGERLKRARALAEEAVRSTRDIALLLRPSHLDDLGLEAALQWLVEDFSRRTGIPCRFSATGLEANLPDAWRTCVYRIVQEAIHNCEKHAAPLQVQIRIAQERDLLTLEVQDDGVGFEVNEKGAPLRSAGLGILGIRERAAMLGGQLRITSAPGRGTTVRVALPVSLLSEAAAERSTATPLLPHVEA